jgi:hypothetical protein
VASWALSLPRAIAATRYRANTTLWPDSTFRFRTQTKRFDIDAYIT